MTEMMTRTEARTLTVADYEARIHLYREQIGVGYIGIGRTLNEAKEAGVVPAGQWEAWVTDVTGLTVRQAQRCMQAAREIRDGSALARLEMSKAMRLLSAGLDEDQREELAEKATQDELTVKELEAEIRKLKGGFDQAVEQAKQWEQRARESFAEGQKSAQRAQGIEDNLRLVQKDEEIRKLRQDVVKAQTARDNLQRSMDQESIRRGDAELKADGLRQKLHEAEQARRHAEEQLQKRQGMDQEQYRIGMEAGRAEAAQAALRDVEKLRQQIRDQERLLGAKTQELQQLKLEKRQQQMAEARTGTRVANVAPAVEWINAQVQLPEDNVDVLAVKELKSGQRDICIARCNRSFEYYDVESGEKRMKPYWICGGNNNILYWMTLPEMPGQ